MAIERDVVVRDGRILALAPENLVDEYARLTVRWEETRRRLRQERLPEHLSALFSLGEGLAALERLARSMRCVLYYDEQTATIILRDFDIP